MNAREQARFDMIKRVATFGTNNASDFTSPIPAAGAVTASHERQKRQRYETPANLAPPKP
jgi:hypothetical protein